MIKLKAYGQRIEHKVGVTSYIPVLKEIKITKIKNTSTRKGQCGYYGYCPNYFEEFPLDDPNDIMSSKGWCHFIKAQNKYVKIPIVPMGKEINI